MRGVVSMALWWLLYRGVYGPTGMAPEMGSTASTVVIPSDLAHEDSSSRFATMVLVDADCAGHQYGEGCEGSPISLDPPVAVWVQP